MFFLEHFSCQRRPSNLAANDTPRCRIRYCSITNQTQNGRLRAALFFVWSIHWNVPLKHRVRYWHFEKSPDLLHESVEKLDDDRGHEVSELAIPNWERYSYSINKDSEKMIHWALNSRLLHFVNLQKGTDFRANSNHFRPTTRPIPSLLHNLQNLFSLHLRRF